MKNGIYFVYLSCKKDISVLFFKALKYRHLNWIFYDPERESNPTPRGICKESRLKAKIHPVFSVVLT